LSKNFDPITNRDNFKSFTLGFEMSQSMEDFKSARAVGNAAVHRMESMISGWLTGFEPELRDTLLEIETWFCYSNSVNEQFGDAPHFYAANRHEAHGLCCWMLDGDSHENIFRKSMERYEDHFRCEGTKPRRGAPKFDFTLQRFEDEYIRGLPFEAKDILQGSLDSYLAACVQCKEFSRGAALYEKVGGSTSINEARIQMPLHFGYWLCKRGESGSIDKSMCRKIGERMLRANLQSKWLNHGHFREAATWLKILEDHSQAPPRKPLQVILRAYDLMPRVPRPSFV